MLFFRLMEYLFVAIVLLVFITQIAWPLYKGRPTFPFFRKQRKLEKELADVNQAKLEEGLEKQVKRQQPRRDSGNY